MKNLMILTNGFDPDLRVYKEAKYLVSKGYEVEILCWDREGRHVENRIEIVDDIKITRFYIYSKYGSGIKQLKNMFKFIKVCKKYINENDIKYSFIHCHDLDGVIIGSFIKKNKDKIIFDMHEFYESRQYEKIKYIIRMVIKFIQNRTYKIIYVNDKQTQYMSKKNKEKLVFLPNYPEKEKFNNFKHIKSDILRISYTGYVRHIVPLSNLMQAASELENVDVAINGSGPVYEEIKKLEAKYKNCKVTGAYNHADIVNFYNNTDLQYVVYNKGNANDENALPTKFYEALLTKIPLIVSKNSKMAEFVNKYDIGFCVNGTDKEDIKNVILEAQKNPEKLENMKENMKRLYNEYVWENVVSNLDKIYVFGG